ncbi:unnamed protein product, partial [Discosporangium mesarthrocarpum]
PLHLACSGGHLEVAKALIAAGGKVNSGNSYGNPPIYGAIMGGHYETADMLLESGADPKWANNKASTLLHFLAYSPLGEAAKKSMAVKLIDAGVDFNAQDDDGLTTLHITARDGDSALAQLLLEK